MDVLGISYEGAKVNGRMEGNGSFVFADGLSYQGGFQDGMCVVASFFWGRGVFWLGVDGFAAVSPLVISVGRVLSPLLWLLSCYHCG